MAQTAVRSLNLSVSVAIALYEARRQLGLDAGK
jgi:tRNA(Leu) C34 or U34 (ribose-2'-O)-methylase TrmL